MADNYCYFIGCSSVHEWEKSLSLVFLSIGLHEEVDRRVSQNSLGDVTKLGSKTALNRRVRKIFVLPFFSSSYFHGGFLADLRNHSHEININDPLMKGMFLNR